MNLTINSNEVLAIMSTISYKPYTYVIGWSKYAKYYYGVRYAKNCTPDDLWVSYFTSSKHVKSFRMEYGEPDIINIRRIFDNSSNAIAWENVVLKRMRVVENLKFLNKTDNFAISEKSALEGARKPKSESFKLKLKIANTGKRKSEETKSKISKSKMGVKQSSETVDKKIKAMSDIRVRDQMSKSLKMLYENGYIQTQSKEVSIDNKLYSSISEAWRLTGISKSKIRRYHLI